jgi:hypothetical protein
MARTSRQQRLVDSDVLSRDFKRYLRYEEAARTIRKYEASVVPGLLQTHAYIRATLRAFNPSADTTFIERLEQARRTRQSNIFDRADRPELHFILDEAVLRRQVGAEHDDTSLMLNQLAHLQQLTKLPGVKIQVLPFSAGAHPGLAGSFTVLEFADPADPSLLYLENTGGDTTTRDDQTKIQHHLDIFFALQRAATAPEEATAFIEEVAQDLAARSTRK